MLHTFQIGESVVVKPGVLSPDNTSYSLAGWQGWVTEFYSAEGTVGLDWDSLTLRSIPAAYIRESLIEGLGWESMGLGPDELLPAAPRDQPGDAKAVYEEIMAYHRWDWLADENPGISDLLGPLGDTDEMTVLHTWNAHLKAILRYPFRVCRQEQFRNDPIGVGQVVEVLGSGGVADPYGLLVNVRLKGRLYTVPLCDFEVTDTSSPNFQPVRDYVVWYANR